MYLDNLGINSHSCVNFSALIGHYIATPFAARCYEEQTVAMDPACQFDDQIHPHTSDDSTLVCF